MHDYDDLLFLLVFFIIIKVCLVLIMYLARTKKACFSRPKWSFWVWQGFLGFLSSFEFICIQ